MKTTVVPLIGDPTLALYQLGLRERESFLNIESRVTKLLSTNALLREGQDFVMRARTLFRKKENSLFEKCIQSYSEGMKVGPSMSIVNKLPAFSIARTHHFVTEVFVLRSFFNSVKFLVSIILSKMI